MSGVGWRPSGCLAGRNFTRDAHTSGFRPALGGMASLTFSGNPGLFQALAFETRLGHCHVCFALRIGVPLRGACWFTCPVGLRHLQA